MRLRPPLLDVLAAGALLAFLVGVTPVSRITQPNVRHLNGWGYGLLALAGLALLGRRLYPSATYAVSVASATAYLALRFPGWPIYLGAVAGLEALVGSRTWPGWLGLAVGGGAAVSIATGRPENWQPARMVVVAVGWAVIAVLLGQAAEARRRRAAQDARAQVIEERLRIARELHDVLSHSLASISMQAGVGLHLMSRRPEQAAEALATIRRVSTDALAQARDALAVVRAPVEARITAFDGAPGLDGLEQLIASVRSAGTPVTLDLPCELAELAVPEAVSATVYRVVQEALTNVMRHADARARARVRLRRRADQIVVEIQDDGVTLSAAPSDGHGLTGMRERVAGHGGGLEVGPAPEGGWRVRAVIPLR